VSFFIFRRLRFGHCLVIMALKIAYLKVKGAVKKSATKPVDFLDMEAHGL